MLKCACHFNASLTALLLSGTLLVVACDVVPKEAVELSATVGRDLEEVHQAHLALAGLHFQVSKDSVNKFVDDVYRPAFIKQFAIEFELVDKVKRAIDEAPDEILPGLALFVKIAQERVEKKRAELLAPIVKQEEIVVSEINNAHKQLQAAQAIVTGHLASVRKVRDVQNELLAEIGLEGLREKIAMTTADVSTKVSDLVAKGEEIDGNIDDATKKIAEMDEKFKEFIAQFESDEE